mmetsp:Transcript_1215/g.3544  ORF Transcript_1215/g.3544 Transcript_1215/m.3544 type:complete len:225 (-) Transcript_1215:22-696(-)
MTTAVTPGSEQKYVLEFFAYLSENFLICSRVASGTSSPSSFGGFDSSGFAETSCLEGTWSPPSTGVTRPSSNTEPSPSLPNLEPKLELSTVASTTRGALTNGKGTLLSGTTPFLPLVLVLPNRRGPHLLTIPTLPPDMTRRPQASASTTNSQQTKTPLERCSLRDAKRIRDSRGQSAPFPLPPRPRRERSRRGGVVRTSFPRRPRPRRPRRPRRLRSPRGARAV